jgi:glycosyltransferase involved in cell wall biosynthesis
MRLVFVSYNYSPDIHTPQEWLNRVKIYVGSLEWLSKNHTVIRVEQINYTGNFSHNGVQYYCVDSSKKKNYFPRKLNAFVKRLHPDVVIVSGLFFPLQVIQLGLSLGHKVKIIAQNHAERPFTGIKKYFQRFADKYISAYFFASRDSGIEWVNKGNLGSTKKIFEIMEVSSVFFPVEKALAKSITHVSGAPVFLWVGRLNENKNPLTVVNAFLKFLEYQPAANLYMIYQTTELLPELTEILKNENNNCEAVHLIGEVHHKEMQYWYNSADYIISSSYYEGSGTAICEAMSCGCVPIVTEIPSFRAMTANGECGFLYKTGDENALFSTLLQTRNSDLTEKRDKTLEYFKNNLSFEAIATKIHEVAASLQSNRCIITRQLSSII